MCVSIEECLQLPFTYLEKGLPSLDSNSLDLAVLPSIFAGSFSTSDLSKALGVLNLDLIGGMVPVFGMDAKDRDREWCTVDSLELDLMV